jgi:catechol 2,3-dioxygenase-like lactoylglutathione lyase family enzyme
MGQFRFVFTAQDFDRATAFYRDTLGLAVSASWDEHGRGIIFVATGTGQIEIFEYVDAGSAPVPTGMKLAWEVDDVDAEFARLSAAGVPILEAPTDRPWGHRNITIADPDGIVVTLFTVTVPGAE